MSAKTKASELHKHGHSPQRTHNSDNPDVFNKSKSPWEPLCDVEAVVLLLKSFSVDKKKAVASMGFDFLLQYNTRIIRKIMTKWIIDNFDPSARSLNIYGDKIEITARHVEYLLGFKDHGFDVHEVPYVDDGQLDKSVLQFAEMNIKGMAMELKKTPHNSPHFKGMFLLFILTALCAPTLDSKPKSEWLHLIINADLLPHWNLARLILESTVEAVAVFKSQKAPKTLGGCSLLLMAIFCEYSPKHLLKDIWKYDLPRIKDWDDKNTRALHEFITNKEYGYSTVKLMTVIEHHKRLLCGKVPTAHAENVETAFSLILDKVDCWGKDINKMFNLLVDYIDRSSGHADENLCESEEGDPNYEVSDEEDESDSFEDVKVEKKEKKGFLKKGIATEGSETDEGRSDNSEDSRSTRQAKVKRKVRETGKKVVAESEAVITSSERSESSDRPKVKGKLRNILMNPKQQCRIHKSKTNIGGKHAQEGCKDSVAEEDISCPKLSPRQMKRKRNGTSVDDTPLFEKRSKKKVDIPSDIAANVTDEVLNEVNVGDGEKMEVDGVDKANGTTKAFDRVDMESLENAKFEEGRGEEHSQKNKGVDEEDVGRIEEEVIYEDQPKQDDENKTNAGNELPSGSVNGDNNDQGLGIDPDNDNVTRETAINEEISDGIREKEKLRSRMLLIQPIVKKWKPETRAIVHYALNDQLDDYEILIKAKWIDVQRWQLCTLFPENSLTEQIINLVGIRETLSKSNKFFIPTVVRHVDMKRKRAGSKYLPDSPLITTSYLPEDPDLCKEILIPLWSSKPDHWYLCVACMEEEKIFMLDSHPDDKTKKRLDNANRQIRKIATLLSSNKEDERLKRFKSVASWPIEQVKIPRQVNSFDCGMHVIKNMEAQSRRKWTSKQYFEDLTTHRIKTLISLMEWNENVLKEEVKTLALKQSMVENA